MYLQKYQKTVFDIKNYRAHFYGTPERPRRKEIVKNINKFLK